MKSKKNNIAKIFLEEDKYIVEYVEMEKSEIVLKLELSEYLKMVSKKRIKTYIHNLGIEGSLLTIYLLKNEYKYTNDNPTESKSFKKVEGDDGSIFSIEIKVNDKDNFIKFVDSKKILNLKVDVLRKEFLEDESVENELTVVSKSLEIMFDEGHTKDTMSSNAYSFFKKIRFGNSNVNNILPKLSYEMNDFIRESYQGGWVYLNPKHEQMKKTGVTIDGNSLFPSVMYENKMPWGFPKEFEGKYVYDKIYPLYIIKIEVEWISLRENKFPFLKDNHNIDGEYLINGSELEFTLTNIDLEMLKKCYKTGKIKYIGGYKFRSISNLFKDYIDHFIKIKTDPSSTPAQIRIAKLFLNSLYGKFGSKTKRQINTYHLDNEGREIKNLEGKNNSGTMYYTALSCFISSYARRETLNGANENFEHFIYSDTDSLHLDCSKEEIKGIKLHQKELGKWKVEKEFDDSAFLGLKSYGERDKYTGEWEFKMAGLPKEAQETLKIEDFYVGSEIECLVKKRVPTGITYVKRIFRLASSKIGKI